MHLHHTHVHRDTLPHSTGSASNIYASVITEADSTAKYFLACLTNVASAYSCDGLYNCVAITCGPPEMDAKIGAATDDCELGSSAICATKTASAIDVDTTTLEDPAESSAQMDCRGRVGHEKQVIEKEAFAIQHGRLSRD
ncbi:hypothetical protein EDB81DRAFT_921488 [Dactylonectria macrodidyma]|uniref:Uncharacterized protein n=1 Tax=Dactylonectria macrodidyma TaxID=307937 RepID=A0A9P9D6Y9_9HYPO|nr:hypothetical protein EDB81DRAFT_921488 [Dactylonectria macrodidyma]